MLPGPLHVMLSQLSSTKSLFQNFRSALCNANSSPSKPKKWLNFSSGRKIVPVVPGTSFLYQLIDTETPHSLDLLVSMIQTIITQQYWSNPTVITLDASDILKASSLSKILLTLPHIRCLKITIDSVKTLDDKILVLKGLIEALTGSSESESDQPLKWICPDLEKLRVSYFQFDFPGARKENYTKLVDHLQLRRRHDRGLHELKFSNCRGMKSGDMDELKRLEVAREVFVCDDEPIRY